MSGKKKRNLIFGMDIKDEKDTDKTVKRGKASPSLQAKREEEKKKRKTSIFGR